jgi:hypothetical protein
VRARKKHRRAHPETRWKSVGWTGKRIFEGSKDQQS